MIKWHAIGLVYVFFNVQAISNVRELINNYGSFLLRNMGLQLVFNIYTDSCPTKFHLHIVAPFTFYIKDLGLVLRLACVCSKKSTALFLSLVPLTSK